MLVEFRVKNFKSFKDEQVFSMVASSDTSLPENLITSDALGKLKLLSSAVVYGANASGKSNLIDALGFVGSFIVYSLDRKPGSETGVRPFLLNKTTAKSPSEFEVTFIQDKVRYQYGFSLDVKRVYKEWLIAYPKGLPQTWFERNPKPDSDESEWYFGSKLLGEKQKLTELTRSDVLFLSVGAKFNHKQLFIVYKWLSEKLQLVESGDDFLFNNVFTAKRAFQDEKFGAKVKALLRQADLGIQDIELKEKASIMPSEIPLETPEKYRSLFSEIYGVIQEMRSYEGDNPTIIEINFLHQAEDASKKGVLFSVGDESLGTLSFFTLSGRIIEALEKGNVLIVDELDDSLHPLLVKYLVSLFHNPDENRHGAQLIFNTHDTTLLDAELFRRDQVWLVEKNTSGASHLYPLLDLSPRKGEALQRGYLQGRYGAVPLIGESLIGFSTNGKN